MVICDRSVPAGRSVRHCPRRRRASRRRPEQPHRAPDARRRATAGGCCRGWSACGSSAGLRRPRRPRSRSDCATVAKDAATRSVSDCWLSAGRRRSGLDKAHLSLLRVPASVRSSRSNSCVSLTLLVQLVRIRNRSMSETISSGGFSSASAYCRSCSKAASRSARCPLYSQAKWWRFQTSAQPSPPVSLRAPRSKQYVSPDGSASAGVGVGSPSSWQEVDEVLLRRRAFLQRGGAPLGDEVVRSHGCPIDIRRDGCRALRRGRAVRRSGCRKSRDSLRPDSAIAHRANR